MADIATLGLEVDASGAISAVDRYEQELRDLDRTASGVKEGQRDLGQAMKDSARSTKDSDTAARRASASMDVLQGGVLDVATAATSGTPKIRGLIQALGPLAIGSGIMVGVLAGLAAAALAFTKLTADARDARAELEKQIAVLERVAEARRIAEGGGETRLSLPGVQAEARRVANLLDQAIQLGNAALVTQYGDELRRLNSIIRAAIGELGDEEAELERDRQEAHAAQMARLNRELAAVDRQIAAQAAAAAGGFNLPSVQEEEAAARENAERIADIRRDVFGDAIDELGRLEDLERAERIQKEKEAADRIAANKIEAEKEFQRNLALFAAGANIIGGQIGGRAGGALQGAAGGALTGAAVGGPLGAAIGGLVGGISGLFGASKEAKEAAKLAKEAARLEREAAAERRQTLEDDLRARVLTLGGDTTGAALARLDAQQRRERERAGEFGPGFVRFVEGIQQLERAALEANLEAQEQTRILEEQLSVQERTVDALRNVVDNLGKFSDDLLLGPLSPLSPAQQLEEARSQFGALSALALGGDVSAAESLPEAARRLLEASRAFNASGPGFVSDFNLVTATVDLVRDQFAATLSIEEQILESLNLQLQEIIDEREAREADAQRAYDQFNERFNAPGGGGGSGGSGDGDPDVDLDGRDIDRALVLGMGSVVEAVNAQTTATQHLTRELLAERGEVS